MLRASARTSGNGWNIVAEEIAPGDTIVRSPRLAQRLFEERMLVITPRDSMLHRLDEAGTFIWQQLETPQTAGQLIDAIAGHFNGFDKKENSRDILTFLTELAGLGLVEIKVSP
jgi:hypothetical protein